MLNNIFIDLIDLNIQDEKIQNYIKSLPYEYKVKEIKEYIYINYFEYGLSICFKNKIMDSVILYNEGINGYKQFKENLPYNISWKLKNQDIVCKFGDSKIKGGGKGSNIWIAYEELGIEFNFLNKSWEDVENPIIFITIFKPKKSNFCSVCLIETNDFFRCDKCTLVRYCNIKCKDVHIKFHNKYC